MSHLNALRAITEGTDPIIVDLQQRLGWALAQAKHIANLRQDAWDELDSISRMLTNDSCGSVKHRVEVELYKLRNQA